MLGQKLEPASSEMLAWMACLCKREKRPFLWEGAGPPGLGGGQWGERWSSISFLVPGRGTLCGGPGLEELTHPFADGHSLLGHGLGVSHVVLHDGLEEFILILPFEGRLQDRGQVGEWASGFLPEPPEAAPPPWPMGGCRAPSEKRRKIGQD